MIVISRRRIAFGFFAIPMCFALFAGTAFAQNGSGNANGASNSAPLQELQNQIDALQSQIDALQVGSSNEPIELHVNCDNEETISAALASAADSDAPLTIVVSGECNEQVNISRDDVIVVGVNGGATLNGGFSMFNGAARITILDMSIKPGHWEWAVGCFSNAQAEARNVTITGGWIGLFAEGASICRIRNSTIDGADLGTLSNTGANTGIINSTISSTDLGVISTAGGSATINLGSVITGNNIGVLVSSNASVLMWGGVTISDNNFGGLLAVTGGTFRMLDTVIIDNNRGNGIRLEKNTGMDIIFADMQITNNTPNGLSCDPDTSTNIGDTSFFFDGNGNDNDGCSIP